MPLRLILVPRAEQATQVKFPRGGFTTTVEPIDLPSGPVKAKRQFVQMVVALHDGAHARVDGFGLPFANHGHPSESWINCTAPLAGDVKLLDLMQQRRFTFVVDNIFKKMEAFCDERSLTPPFSYPYGTNHGWNIEKYEALIPAKKVSQTLY